MSKGGLVIVDDNKGILSALELLLRNEFGQVTPISSPNLLPSLLESGKYDLVLLDMNFNAGVNSGNEGLYWLSRIKESHPEVEVVMFTAFGDVDLAVKALKQGAADFVLKPWDNERLKTTLHNVYLLRQSKREIKELKRKEGILKGEINRGGNLIVARSPQMIRLLGLAHKVAKTDANVLITGENGTGKELIARELHLHSQRSAEVMVTVDMGSLSETLFESELYGHKKGSFTDAKEDRPGKVESANHGTLFLDEIGNLPLHLQSKLLTTLQNRSITPVGGNKPIDVDIRLISATNRNLNKMVADGSFRQDLLYRLNTIHIEVPPLRERREDILALTEFFHRKFCAKYRKPCEKITESALSKLTNYSWPGNVRELEHNIEKAVILSDKNELTAEDFYFNEPVFGEMEAIECTIEEMERRMIGRTLAKNGHNLSVTAEKLGITRQTLYNKMKKYNL